MEQKDLGSTVTSLPAHIEAVMCYFLGWLSGLIMYFIEKDNKFVRFHALQSMVVFGTLFVATLVLAYIPILGLYLLPFLWLASLIIWFFLMVKAYNGQNFKFPLAGDIAQKYL